MFLFMSSSSSSSSSSGRRSGFASGVASGSYSGPRPYVGVASGSYSRPAPYVARPPAAYSPPRDKVVVSKGGDAQGADSESHHSPSRVASPTLPPYSPPGYKTDPDVDATEETAVPAVEETAAPASVDAVEDPPTLARKLFYYGFLFFPFWLTGIYILLSPLRPTPDWEAGKTEDEKTRLLAILRKTEKKWAWRCVDALGALAVAVVLLVIIIKYGILANV